jgi:hypothetical protein
MKPREWTIEPIPLLFAFFCAFAVQTAYPDQRRDKIAVTVIDLFGSDAMKVVEVKYDGSSHL